MSEENKNNILRRVIESPECRAIDVENRTVEFIASDNSIDSYGTVLPVDKWDLTRFAKNGAVGYMHEVYGGGFVQKADPDDVIGKGIAYVEEGKLIVRITFEPADLNEKADKIFRKIQFGSLNAVSVGFMPTEKGHWGNKNNGENEDVYYYNGQELLEVSVVNIPSNANAVKRSIEAEISQLPAKPAQEPDPKENEIRQEQSSDNSAIIIARAAIAKAKCNS